MRHNGALQFQVQNLSAEIENLKQRRVKAPNENMEICVVLLMEGLQGTLRGRNVFIARQNMSMIINHLRLRGI